MGLAAFGQGIECLEAPEWEPLPPLCFPGAMQTYEKLLPRKGEGGMTGVEVSFMQ